MSIDKYFSAYIHTNIKLKTKKLRNIENPVNSKYPAANPHIIANIYLITNTIDNASSFSGALSLDIANLNNSG